MSTSFADHLLTGDHASRPAATAVPAGTLYACSDHGLIYQSDGATWATWATIGGASALDDLSDVVITAGASGDILRHNGTNWIDAAGIVATDITSGTVPTARLGSGTADATTFLRGDQTYAVPGGGGINYGFTAPPIASAWTQINFNGSDTLTDITPGEGNALLLSTVSVGAVNSVRAAVKAAPATPYTVTTAIRGLLWLGGTPSYAGLTLRESGTGKLITFNRANGAFRIMNWTNPTTFAGDALGFTTYPIEQTPFIVLRITDNGTNLIFSYSGNLGQSWQQILSVGRTAHMAGGPDQIGFHTDPAHTTYGLDLTLYSWAIT